MRGIGGCSDSVITDSFNAIVCVVHHVLKVGGSMSKSDGSRLGIQCIGGGRVSVSFLIRQTKRMIVVDEKNKTIFESNRELPSRYWVGVLEYFEHFLI